MFCTHRWVSGLFASEGDTVLARAKDRLMNDPGGLDGVEVIGVDDSPRAGALERGVPSLCGDIPQGRVVRPLSSMS